MDAKSIDKPRVPPARVYLFSAASTLTEGRPLTSRPGPLFEIGDRGLALRSDVPVRVAADVIAAPLEQGLQFLPSLRATRAGSSVGHGVTMPRPPPRRSASTQAARV